MGSIAHVSAAVVAATTAAVGGWGALLWWRVEPRAQWWPALRVVQALCGVFAVEAGVLYVAGFRPDSLFWLYALLPVGVNFFAEQLRLVSAQSVLAARDIEDAKEVGALPPDQQRSVVRQIMRREMGVMVLATLVVTFLALRALGTA